MGDVPATPRSFRLSDADLTRLGRLQRVLGRSQTEVVSMALVHLLATLQRDERVHLHLPEDETLFGDDQPGRRPAPGPEPPVQEPPDGWERRS